MKIEEIADEMSRKCSPFKKEEYRLHYVDGVVDGFEKSKSMISSTISSKMEIYRLSPSGRINEECDTFAHDVLHELLVELNSTELSCKN